MGIYLIVLKKCMFTILMFKYQGVVKPLDVRQTFETPDMIEF